jgi:hypothetical protein
VFLVLTAKLELSAVQDTDPTSVKENLLNYGVVGTFVLGHRASNSRNSVQKPKARIPGAAHRLPKHLRRAGWSSAGKLSRAVLD